MDDSAGLSLAADMLGLTGGEPIEGCSESEVGGALRLRMLLVVFDFDYLLLIVPLVIV